MTANELRIGNWVQNDNKLIKCESVGEEGINLYSAYDGRDGTLLPELLFEDLNSVPLTIPILISIGFDSSIFECRPAFSISYKRQREESERQYIMLLKHENIEGFSVVIGNSQNQMQIGICNVTFLHQIQNLFFVLTGDELAL